MPASARRDPDRLPRLRSVRGQGASKPPTVPRSKQLAQMPTSDIICRVAMGNRHSIDPTSYHLEPNGWGGHTLVFTCPVCGTEIRKHRDRHGFIISSNSYKHRKPEKGQPGYLMEEGGRLTDGERAALWNRFARGAR